MSVNYKLLDSKNKLIKGYSNAACFSSVMDYSIDKQVKKIVVYQSKNTTAHTEKMCVKWIKLINKWGFFVTYKGLGSKAYDTKENEHVFVIDLDKKDNAHRAWCISSLNLIRYLTENGVHIIIEKFYELNAQLKLKRLDDQFQLMQFCHQYLPYSSGHALTENISKKCITLKEFKIRVKELNKTIHSSNNIKLFKLWDGRRVPKQKDFQQARNKGYMNVLVVGGNQNLANWLPVEVKFVKEIENAELVMFDGGSDVDPSMYNEPKGKQTQSNLERDKREKKIFEKAKKLGIPMWGTCRGLSN